MLLVNASNVFSSLSHEVFLHNISNTCPAISIFVKNYYNFPPMLFIVRRKESKLNEGTTQSDPLSIVIYSIGGTPLINMLIDIAVTFIESQVDDFSAAGKLDNLRKWWDILTIIDLKFGCSQEPTKTWFVINPYASQGTINIFSATKIKIISEGYRHLRGVIGTEKFKYIYMEEKVIEWINQI